MRVLFFWRLYVKKIVKDELMVKSICLVVSFALLSACASPAKYYSIREPLDRNAISKITSSELVVLFDYKDAWVADYREDHVTRSMIDSAMSQGFIGGVIGVVISGFAEEKLQKLHDRQKVSFGKLNPYLSKNEIGKILPPTLYGKLKKIRPLKIKKAKKIFIQQKKEESYHEARKRYLNSIVKKSKNDVVIVANVKNMFNASLSEYMVFVDLSIFPKNRLGYVNAKKDPSSGLPILYRNIFIYSAEQLGVNDDVNSVMAWTTDSGYNHISNIAKRSLTSISSLITHDLGVFLKKGKEKKLSKELNYGTALIGWRMGEIIAESKYRRVYRNGIDNSIVSLSRVPSVDSLRSHTDAANKNAKIHIIHYIAGGTALAKEQEIFINGKFSGVLPNNSYLYLEVPPGDLTIESRIPWQSKLSFEAKQGGAYYLTQLVPFRGAGNITPIPWRVGASLVKNMKKTLPGPRKEEIYGD